MSNVILIIMIPAWTKKTTRLLVLLAALICLTAGIAQSATPVKVLVLGDSLSAGYGLAKPDTFPVVLEATLKKAGYNVKVPFKGGRGDATQDQTDAFSFGLLEPKADGFRNYITRLKNGSSNKTTVSAEEMLVDKAQLMKLSAPEMTVLIGGMRVLNTNFDKSKIGVFTNCFGGGFWLMF